MLATACQSTLMKEAAQTKHIKTKMMSISSLFSFLFLFSVPQMGSSAFTANELQNTVLHKYHLSKTLIEYNEKEQAIQISMHLFIDDLEETLRYKGIDKLFICTKKEAADAEIQIAKYISQNFQLTINDEIVKWDFLGKEASEDLIGVWCYLEITDVRELKSLGVSNKLLLEVFEDQKNITQISGPQNKRGYFIFQKGQYTDEVQF